MHNDLCECTYKYHHQRFIRWVTAEDDCRPSLSLLSPGNPLSSVDQSEVPVPAPIGATGRPAPEQRTRGGAPDTW